MVHFPITENVESALALASRSRRDDLGYCYHTFRITLTRATGDWQEVLTRLINEGWQLLGGPHLVNAPGVPRHLVLSMLHAGRPSHEAGGQAKGCPPPSGSEPV